jgi:hypothetical protein
MIEQFGLLVLFFAVALIGVYVHWLKRKLRQQTGVTFLKYIKDHPNNTLSAVGSIFASVFLLFQGGDMGLEMRNLALAFSIGFSLDSMFNK